jgi:membrane protein DedA with SNARE-associated domain
MGALPPVFRTLAAAATLAKQKKDEIILPLHATPESPKRARLAILIPRPFRRCPSMSLHELVQQAIDFVKAHEAWAPLIAGFLAFGESFAFISLIIPATTALIGIGALIGASDIPFVPVWIGASVGAALGDWISYWIGLKVENVAHRVWPLSRYPQMVERGEAFFKRYGTWSIMLGRFFGPVRAVIPLVAGMFEMPFIPFQIANWVSAFVWAFALLAPGFTALKYL